MFFPDKNGVIKVGGKHSGGHAYIINGVDTKTKMFRLKNSWGKTWGKSGSAFISFSDMDKLIKQNGEICLAVELI
jgi:C1A family cysteine protease